MDLTSVKYQDSCIFIEIDSSLGERDGKPLLERVRSVYASYKIIAFGNFVKDTILIKKLLFHEVDDEIYYAGR